MKTTMARYFCADGDVSFEAPKLGESSYGEFLLWSSGGQIAYLNALDDAVYAEVKELIEEMGGLGQDPFKVAEILQQIFGQVACDPDQGGAAFVIDAYPPCPEHEGGQVTSWEMIDPPKVIEIDIPSVTHELWARLSTEQKRQAVADEIDAGRPEDLAAPAPRGWAG